MNLKAPTISIRDNRDNQIGVLYDYFNDSIELFLEGKVSILTLSVLDENNYRELLVNGNSLSFTYKSEDYHMTIVKSDEDEDVITITAWSLVLELNNETKAPFSGTSLTFAQYLNAFDGEKILTLNINEVSDKKISHKFDSQQTMLERLFSLAKLFNAEIEFKTILADNGSLERLEINVYRANDSKNQGLGENRSSEVFYFGEEITTVKKSSDIMNLFTAIRPVGKDGLNLNNYTMNDVKGEDGETLFYLKNGMIYAPRARELYPSNLINKADGWTVYDWATEYESQATLCGNALAKLRDELSTPAVTWTIEGYIDANIGDTISVHDNGYKPTLLLEARINSQRISMTNPSSNETTFSNVKEVQSEISAELIAKMNDIIKEKIQYTTSIITTNGTFFKNGKGSTVLKARVLSNNADIADKVSISWYKDDSFVKSGTELTVSASDIVEKAVYRFEVIDTYGNVKNVQEVTIFNVDDGSNGLGIKNITNKYAVSKSNVTPPTSWVDTPPRITEETKYLWNYDIITYTDNTTSETSKRVIGVYGDKGLDGLAGKDGLGVKSTSIIYAGSTNGTVAPTTGWSTSIPAVPAGNYLWTKTTWAYTDGTSENGFTVSRIGKDGNTGKDGIAGKDGVGIKETSVQYAGSTSGTTPPTTGWTATVPTVASGSYLWTKTTWSYTDDTNETGYSVSKMGEPGAKGNTGDSATSYWVTPSVNAIQISTTKVLNPTTVTFTGYSKTGTANAGLYAGRFNILTSVDGIAYSSKYSSSANQSAYTYTVPADVKFIKARMYQSGGTSVLVDEVTIPIIESAEGLEIGNRNYFSVKAWNDKPNLSSSGVPYMEIKVEPNTQYTLSTNIPKQSGTNQYDVFFFKENESVSSLLNGVAKNEPRTIMSPSTGIVKVAMRSYDLSAGYWIMLSKGNKAIDWQPALEDAVTYQRWSNDPNGLVDMTATYPNENLLEDSISMSGWSTGTLTENAYLDTFNSRKNTRTVATQTSPIVVAQKTVTELLKPSTTYTVSFVARGNFVRTYAFPSVSAKATGSQGQSNTSNDASMDWTLTSDWKEYSYTFTTLSSLSGTKYILFRLDNSSIDTNAEVARVKLEEGNKTIYTSNQAESKLLSVPQYVGVGVQNTMNPSDFTWTINPEYTQALADLGLKDKVDNGSYENDKSDIWEEIGNRVTGEEAQEIRDMAEALKNSYEAFISEGGQYQSDLEALDARSALLVQNLGDKLATYNFLDTHIKLGEEGLLIGAKGDPMKMLLSKDKLSFTDGGEVVAYFSKQSFYINRGAIVDSLQVGQHKMVKLNANHTIFQWITG